MILLLECKVESDTLIDQVIELRVSGYLFKLYPDDQQKFTKITVESTFPNYKQYVPKLSLGEDQIPVLEFPEENFYPEQVSMLQFIESFSALDKGVKRIHWDNPVIKWIPENEEEKIAIRGYSKTIAYRPETRKMTFNWFQQTIIHRRMLGHLTEPFSFYRIGNNHYHQHAYIQAFLHFFLMLEGIFGNGKTNKDILIGAFMDAPYLAYGINNVLMSFEKPVHRKHREWFDGYLFKGRDFSNDPVRKMVNIFVEERGKLAHYITTNRERRRNNFEDQKYQSLATTAMLVCHFCSVKLKMDPFIKK